MEKSQAVENTMYQWMKDLFPLNRSLTGKGTLDTLKYFQKLIPEMKIESVQSGTQAFDWTVPEEWNLTDAWIKDEQGNKVVDFKTNNLHVMGYSVPVDVVMDLDELRKNLHSLPEMPDAIPYLTSYYKKRWGFCISENQRKKLKPGKYHVKIDSSLASGNLNYGEIILPGKSKKEVLLSTYVCHPSMANNELSGPVVTAALVQWLKSIDRRYTYRIVFIPETIGSIVYLSRNLNVMKERQIAGFVLSCMGDERSYSYLESRSGKTLPDKVARHVLKYLAPDYKFYSFLKRGSDERQYCSPGVDLPVCSIMRSKYGEYPEYHTSLDDLNFVTPAGLAGGFTAVKNALVILEHNHFYKMKVLCEPQLGKRGLYPASTGRNLDAEVQKMMNFIAYADGSMDLVDIAEKIGENALDLLEIISKLVDNELLEKIEMA